MDKELEPTLLRIGEISSRLGVSEHVLRAWERRYGLLAPVRSEGGYRLYTPSDENVVRRMLAHMSRGMATSEAAKATLNEVGVSQQQIPREKLDLNLARVELRERLDQFDEPAAQALLDRVFADFAVEVVLRDLLIPYLQDMGQRWLDKTLGIGQEHFASNIFRARLVELSRGWGTGKGPIALLACPPGEIHEFSLLISGIVLHRSGWRIRYLGTNTPMQDLLEVTQRLKPAVVLLSSMASDGFAPVQSELKKLSGLAPLVLGGIGATQAIADETGATLLPGDPITAAQELARRLR